MSDSKGAAIEKILMKFGDEAVDSLFKDEKVTVKAFATAKQAILAILAQEVKQARIDELENFSDWINKGLAETHRIKRLKQLERLG